jgi:hypothetical protein
MEEPVVVAAGEGGDGAVQDGLVKEPYRPQRNRDLLKFHLLLACISIGWTELNNASESYRMANSLLKRHIIRRKKMSKI